MRFLFVLFSISVVSNLAFADTPFQTRIATDIDGKAHDIAALLGGGDNVALIFWQTWCATCKVELPAISTFVKQSKPGIKFFGVVTGTDEFVSIKKVRSFVDKLDLSFPQIRDENASISEQFKVEGTPTIIVIGEKGELIHSSHRAPDDWSKFARR